MKFTKFIRSKFEDTETDTDLASGLNEILDNVIRPENRRDEVKTKLAVARKTLQDTQAEELDDRGADVDGAVAAVVAEKEKLDGLEKLVEVARSKAVGAISAASIVHRDRLEEVEAEITDTRQEIDARTVKAVAEFAKKYGFEVILSTKQNGGAIKLPSMSIEGEALQKAVNSAVVGVHRDADAEKLEQLHAERRRLVVITRSTPDLALDELLAERRRQK